MQKHVILSVILAIFLICGVASAKCLFSIDDYSNVVSGVVLQCAQNNNANFQIAKVKGSCCAPSIALNDNDTSQSNTQGALVMSVVEVNQGGPGHGTDVSQVESGVVMQQASNNNLNMQIAETFGPGVASNDNCTSQSNTQGAIVISGVTVNQ